MPNKGVKPRFVHSCPHCTFLGQFGLFDLYVCMKEIPMVLARFDHDDRDCKSSLATESDDPELAEAVQRAKDRGLLKTKSIRLKDPV